MQTAFHIYSLVQELNKELLGAKIVSTEFYKKERSAYLICKNKSRLALSFVYHPTKSGIYLISPSKINLTTREKPWPIFALEGAEITKIEQLGFDRIIQITVSHKDKIKYLIFEALGPNGNLWLLNDKKEKEATLRKKDIGKNELYEISPLPGKLNPNELTAVSLLDACSQKPDLALTFFLDRTIIGFNITLAIELQKRIGLDPLSVSEIDKTVADKIISGIQELIESFEQYDKGYLYQVKGMHEAYPFKLSSVDIQPEKFKTLSLASMSVTEKKNSKIETVDEEKIILTAVRKQIKKLKKRIENVTRDIAKASDYETYKLYGELLQINFAKIKKGMESITVANIYDSAETELTISLDESLSPNENAERYFKKHRKGREGLELLKRRLDITNDEHAQTLQMQTDLELQFQNAKEKYASEIASLLPKEHSKAVIAERLPYREHQLTTGLTIYIGRDGSDNDRTTFEFCKPYELWFHAQQCPGSHVVMKYPNKNFEPSKQEIEETAAIAAFHSKARNDTMVPVIYTQRKYVRKPRKAKAGLVTVEREKSVMVTPKNHAE